MVDRRYGSTQYGQIKYGASDFATLLYALEVDWDDDDVFDGQNEAYISGEGRLKRWVTRRGRDHYLQGADQAGFTRWNVGKADIWLDDPDGRLNPNNTSSPLYPNVKRGRKAKFWVRDGSGGTDYDLLTGIVTNIQPVGGTGSREIKISLEGGERVLRSKSTNVALQTSVTVDDAIGDILTDIGWPSIWGRDLSVGTESVSYHYEDDRPAFRAIFDLVEMGISRAWVGADGKFNFRTRHDISSSVQITEGMVLKDPKPMLKAPWESFRDRVVIPVRPRVVQATAELWRMQDTPSIAAGASKTFWGQMKYENRNVAISNPVNPVASTDYTMNTQSDGGGTDLTSSFTVTPTYFGERVKYVVANGSGSEGFVTLLKQRGDAIDQPDLTMVEAGSGDHDFRLETPWMQDANFAQDLATFLLDFLQTLPPFVVFSMEDRHTTQLALDLTSQIELDLPTMDINTENYRVGQIVHESVGPTCQAIRSHITSEPFADLSGAWSFPMEFEISSDFAV